MEIKSDYDFRDLEKNCWGQATSILDEISKAGLEDELMDYLEDSFYGDIPTLTEVNDLLAYDWEQVYDAIGYFNLEDNIDVSKVKEIISEIESWTEHRAITNSDLIAYDDLMDGSMSESDLSEQIDEIKGKLITLKDSLEELLDCDSKDELDDKKSEVDDNLADVDNDCCVDYLSDKTYSRIEKDVFTPLSKLL